MLFSKLIPIFIGIVVLRIPTESELFVGRVIVQEGG